MKDCTQEQPEFHVTMYDLKVSCTYTDTLLVEQTVINSLHAVHTGKKQFPDQMGGPERCCSTETA